MMSLSNLAALGSFVSGLAVIVTLMFLSLQIRQTNRNQRSLIQQARSSRNAERVMRLSDPHMSAIMVRAENKDPTLEPWEINSYVRMINSYFSSFEDSFLQFRSGTLHAEGWHAEQ